MVRQRNAQTSVAQASAQVGGLAELGDRLAQVQQKYGRSSAQQCCTASWPKSGWIRTTRLSTASRRRRPRARTAPASDPGSPEASGTRSARRRRCCARRTTPPGTTSSCRWTWPSLRPRRPAGPPSSRQAPVPRRRRARSATSWPGSQAGCPSAPPSAALWPVWERWPEPRPPPPSSSARPPPLASPRSPALRAPMPEPRCSAQAGGSRSRRGRSPSVTSSTGAP